MCGEKWLTFDDVTDFVGESNTEFKIELKKLTINKTNFSPTTSAQNSLVLLLSENWFLEKDLTSNSGSFLPV